MACLLHRGDAAASRTFAEPGVGPTFAPSRTFRIAHHALTLWLEPDAARFRGEARIRYRLLPSHTGELALDLDDVTVDEVLVDGAARPFTHDDATLRVAGVAEDGELVVRWHGADPVRGLYFTGPTPWEPDRQHMAWTQCQDEDAHFVLPCHDHPGVKHPWTITLRAPAGYTLLSNGRLASSGEDDEGAYATYEQAEPMPAYLLTAVAARLTAIDAEAGPVPVRYLVPEGQEEAVARSMGKTPLMIEAFAARTGVAFPWPRYDQVVVHDFIFGGMENVACTTMTDLLLVDERATVEWDPDGLVAHELAHQWFGDLVTCRDWSQAWLNESWATFMEVVWWEHDRTEAEATWYRFGLFRNYLDEDGSRYRRPIVTYDFREPIDVFDRHLYEKGACVLATLRAELGDDAFWGGVNRYLSDNQHRAVHSRDFQRALEESTGVDLDRFFRQWVHGAGHPELKVGLSAEDGLLLVAVKQTQEGEGTPDAWHLKLRVEVVLDGADPVTVTLPIRERERTFAIPVPADVVAVRVDPGFHVLADIQLSGRRAWLERTLVDDCPVLSVRSAAALLKEGTPKAVAAVMDAVRTHPNPRVRGELGKRVAARGDAATAAALIDALAAEEDPRAARGIVAGLGKLRHDGVADALIALLAAPIRTWHLHGEALIALGHTRDPRAVHVIATHLDTASWAEVIRCRALDGLAATEDPDALELVVAKTRADTPDRVRASAATALGTLADRVESVRQASVDRLLELLREPGFRTLAMAIDALGRAGDPRALGPLGVVHETAADGRHRRGAYEAMARIRKGRTTEAGLAALRRRLDELTEENRALRVRVDKLERQ